MRRDCTFFRRLHRAQRPLKNTQDPVTSNVNIFYLFLVPVLFFDPSFNTYNKYDSIVKLPNTLISVVYIFYLQSLETIVLYKTY